MCGNDVTMLKKKSPQKILYAGFEETPLGYCYILQADPSDKCSFKGNIFQITNHVKWLNAKKGYLGAYFQEKSLFEKALSIGRIALTLGWLRKRKKLPNRSLRLQNT